jgi:hypothetical protein
MCSGGRGESVIGVPDCCMHQIKKLELGKKYRKRKKERKTSSHNRWLLV